MKKLIALLLTCVLLTLVIAPVAAFAANDDFVGSVEQTDPVDQIPYPDRAPQTGEEFPVALVVAAVFFAGAAVGLFAVAGKKQKG